MSARAVILLCLSALIGLGSSLDVAAAQPRWHRVEAGEYRVGFRLSEERDDTRVIAGPTDQARPIRVYMWYPATVLPGAESMPFGRYASLAEGDVWPTEVVGPHRERLSFSNHVLTPSLGPGGVEALARQPMLAFENAEPLSGPFPLIVIGQGFNFESPIALATMSEYLASRGFVVATCPLVGTDTPFVKLDVEDLESQIRDMELVIARARAFPHVSPDELGVMGFDMGGMAGLILAMRNPAADAFVSLESGILFPHASGIPAASHDYDPAKLRIPWLHATRRRAPPDGVGASLFELARHSERYHLEMDDLKHEDPTSFALIEGRAARLGYWSAWEPEGVDRHRLLSGYVSEFFKAYLTSNSESLAFLSRGVQQGVAQHGLTMEHRSATPPAMTYAQFVDALLAGDAAGAIDEVRGLRDVEPSHILLNDSYLYRLTYTLLYRWGLSDEAMQLGKLNAELHPSSSLAARGLSMVYVSRGDHTAAIEVYRNLLELNPDDDNVKRTLAWLEGQLELLRDRE